MRLHFHNVQILVLRLGDLSTRDNISDINDAFTAFISVIIKENVLSCVICRINVQGLC